ncbi:MAG: O-antigen ligase family protein [Bacteroidales bacterium]|nr:O-antigen ligase family protein [Bacteroidales bacterium]
MTGLENLRKYSLVFTAITVYVVANMILTANEFYFLNLIPVAVILIFIFLIRLDVFYFAIIVLTPLSIQLIEFIPGSPVDFAIPTEPMLFAVLLLLIYKMAQGEFIDTYIMNHPVTYAVLFYLFWMMMTSITSSDPLVSFKYLLARIWFIATFYFLAAALFRKTSNIRIFIWCYAVPMMLVAVYTMSRHIGYGLYDRQIAHIVMSPFFRDHTSYGAVLAMLFFALGGVMIHTRTKMLFRILFMCSSALIAVALVLSYTRAAWISVLCSFIALVLILLKVRFRLVILVGIAVVIILFGQRTEIVKKMQHNRQASSVSLSEHLQSVANITTDESNLERINRWNSAIRMFKERPVFGWGPGTYMFEYAPYQLSYEMTDISTNFGDRGNAHSEYLGPLAESGVPGLISFLLIGILSILTGFRVFRKIKGKRLKIITLGMILGFLTYLIHGILNNFLDTDKASALFWGFTAAFVSLDVYAFEKKEEDCSKG